MGSSVKVSICVAQYNRADRIAKSIGSLLAQDFSDFEVIVVNDGSPDDKVREELEKLSCERLTIIHQDNTGFVGAMRKAIDNARGEYIAIHGAGDISLPNRIRTQSDFLDQNQDYSLVSCHYTDVEIDSAGEGKRKLFALTSGDVPESDLTYKPTPIGHGEVMYRKSAYSSIGGYRHFFKFAQDKDLWLRLIKTGKFFVIPINLYERGLFKTDGIATNHEKLYLQKVLMAFAVQCYEMRETCGKDLLDVYGKQAGLLRKPSKKVSDFCFLTSLRLYMNDNLEDANTFIERSLMENKNLKNFLLNIIINLSAIRVIKILLIHTLRKIRQLK